ncbi:hypothetical protein [Coleofasciculus chthonoplastes]|nr:hypothetical protein [Coleofasciculus chthonoplastes]
MVQELKSTIADAIALLSQSPETLCVPLRFPLRTSALNSLWE